MEMIILEGVTDSVNSQSVIVGVYVIVFGLGTLYSTRRSDTLC
jgi:hypothetical protein